MAIIQPYPTIDPIRVDRSSISAELIAEAGREANELNSSRAQGHLDHSNKEGAGLIEGFISERVCNLVLKVERQEGDAKFDNDLKEIDGESEFEVKTKGRTYPATPSYDGAVTEFSFENQKAQNYIFCNNVYESKRRNNKGHYEYFNLKVVEIIGVISRKDFEDGMNIIKDVVVWDNNERRTVSSPIVRFVKKGEIDPLDPRSPNHVNQYKIRYSALAPVSNFPHLLREVCQPDPFIL